MTAQRKAMVAGLALMVLAVVALKHMIHSQRLGEPGVRVVQRDVYSDKKQLVGTNMVILPPQVLNYASSNQPVATIVSDWLPKDTTFGCRRYWTHDDFFIDNTVVLMGADRTSIHEPEYCLTGSGWLIATNMDVSITLDEPEPHAFSARRMNMVKIVDVGGKQVEYHGIYVFWFVSATQSTSDLKQAMWMLGRNVLATGVLDRWAYVSYFTAFRPGNEAEAYERVEKFIQASAPQFVLSPPKASSARDRTALR